MRSIKYVAALGAALIVSLGSAAGASAHKFHAEAVGKVKSHATTNQVFTGPFGIKVTCTVAAGEGTSAIESTTQAMTVNYSGCTGGEPVNPVEYVFSAEGTVEIAKEVTINKTFCGTVKVPKQTASGMTYSTEGSGKARKVKAVANVKVSTSCGENTYTGTNVTEGEGFGVWWE